MQKREKPHTNTVGHTGNKTIHQAHVTTCVSFNVIKIKDNNPKKPTFISPSRFVCSWQRTRPTAC